MSLYFKIFKWLSVFFLLIAMTLYTNKTQGEQKIYLDNLVIDTDSNQYITNKDIVLYLEQNSFNLEGSLHKDFQKEYLEQLLQSHALIKDVEVFTTPNGALNIYIQQKKAIVRIMTDHDNCYLDEYGMRMNLSKNSTSDLIVVTGDVSSTKYSEVYKLINQINEQNFLEELITQIHYQDGNILLIPRVGSEKINIGKITNLKNKFKKLRSFYKSVVSKEKSNKYSEINLKYDGQIVCTKKLKNGRN